MTIHTTFLSQQEEFEEKLPEKMHEWYLEACQRPESGMDFNPAAQEPYENLKDTQKFLDEYIAGKVLSLYKQSYLKFIEVVEGEIKKLDTSGGGSGRRLKIQLLNYFASEKERIKDSKE